MAAFKDHGTLTVDEDEFFWRVRHWVGAPGLKGQNGLSLSVSVDPGKRRELIVEFPYTEFGAARPKSELAFAERLRGCIAAAIAEGYRPNSRGRPWIHEADPP